MKRVLLTSLLFFGCGHTAEARLWEGDKSYRQIKVAVIDTGLSAELYAREEYCKTGHRDFTVPVPEIPLKPTMADLDAYQKKMYKLEHPEDEHGHGTHISGLVDQYAKNFILTSPGPKDQGIKLGERKANYCQIILKFYDSKGSDINNLNNTIKAIRWAIEQKVDIINYSGGGIAPNAEEKAAVIEALDKGIKFVASAGNEHSDLDVRPFYPAMYDKRIYVVGFVVKPEDIPSRKPGSMSNYGKPVNTWEVGKNIISRLPNGQFGFMSGTSQSAAIKSGKLVREMLNTK